MLLALNILLVLYKMLDCFQFVEIIKSLHALLTVLVLKQCGHEPKASHS